jgi:lipopolysaccharide export system permease protein
MMIHRCDRYILSEMVGPFLVSLSGLLLFILLNLILSLSDLMVDRGVGIGSLINLLLLKLPSLLVLALPVSGLFATFLGLGRLVHDREVIAFQAAGISLRRLLLPLVIAATFLAGADFALYNWAVPTSEHLYQQTLRSIIFRGGVPHVRANTFFKGEEGEFFYMRNYNEKTQALEDIIVYDVTGDLFPQSDATVIIITAQTGLWKGSSWSLNDGKVYGYDHDGGLIYSGSFSSLDIATGQLDSQFLFGSRTPSEMTIGELRDQIALLSKSGSAVDDLIVECNLKVAMPVATIVFVLFGGAASLIFAWRSRAVGIVIGFLLVGLFQGSLLWTQTLGRRGIISPPLGAWLPDIIFGAIGIALFMALDRLRCSYLWKQIKRVMPFFIMMLFFATFAHAQNPPVAEGDVNQALQTASETTALNLRSDSIIISSDYRHVTAHGNVHLAYGKTSLSANSAMVDKGENGRWQLQAEGDVDLKVEENFTLSGERISAVLSYEDQALGTQEATANAFNGKSSFINSDGEKQTLIYRGSQGTIKYNKDGTISQINMSDATLTTCDCCDRETEEQPYSIETASFILYPNQLIVAFNLTVRSFGVRVFWLPVYVQPLKETMDSPLFPSIGNSSLRGWFFKWNIPFFLNKDNYGAVLFDYFTRFQEIGLGTILRYAVAGHSGSMKGYYFPAKVGDSKVEFSLTHTSDLPHNWKITGSVSYSDVAGARQLTFSSSTGGSIETWNLSINTSRTINREEDEEENDEDDQKEARIDERLPEITLSRSAYTWGDLSFTPSISVGWFREWEENMLAASHLRADVSITMRLSPINLLGFSLASSGSLRLTSYEGGTTRRREAHSISLSLSRPGMNAAYSYREINGESPFVYDHLVEENHIAFNFAGTGDLSLKVKTGIDLLSTTFDPLEIGISLCPGPKLFLDATYDITSASFTGMQLRGRAKFENMAIEWSVPYDAISRKFETSTLGVKAQSAERGKISIACDFDVNSVELVVLSLQAEILYKEGWGISLSGKLDTSTQTWTDNSFGLFHDFCDCLRIGIERSSGQVWLYTSILAFPEAVLRYAPTTTEIELGNQ